MQVKAAARAYRVYYTKTNDDPEDYLVDHSIIMYLLNPQGQFMAFYGKNLDRAELSDKICQSNRLRVIALVTVKSWGSVSMQERHTCQA